MKLEFKPEDFFGNQNKATMEARLTINMWAIRAASEANARLAEMLKDAPVVYGVLKGPDAIIPNGISIDWTTFPQVGRSHHARLVCMEEIKK